MTLETHELEEMRADATEFLPDEAKILRRSGTGNTEWGGKGTGTWTEVATVRALLTSSDQQEGQTAAGTVGVPRVVVNLPAGTDVRITDRIEIGGQVYEVVGLTAGDTWEILRQATVREINNGA